MLSHSFGVETVFLRARVVLGLTLACCLMFVASASADTAATLRVTTAGTDSGNCQVDACSTIAYAISEASAGDTIEVGPGNFAGATINKSVILEGAQAGVDGRTRTSGNIAEETVIAAPNGTNASAAFRVAANGVTIDGFTVQGTGTAGTMTWGIHAAAGVQTTGGSIRNNVFRNLFESVFLAGANGQTYDLTIEKNAFRNEGSPFKVAAGVYMAGTANDGVIIRHNSFSGMDKGESAEMASVNFNNTTDLLITGNESSNETTFLALVNADGVEISNNTITDQAGSSIFIGKGVVNAEITDNEISDGYRAIRLSSAYGTGLSHDVQIEGNSISGFETASVVVDSNAVSGNITINRNRIVDAANGFVNNSDVEIDAKNNWWGCNAGPGGEGCDPVTGPVLTSPNVVLAAEASSSRIAAGNNANVTATLVRNSAGDPVQMPVLDGREVTFETTGGTVSPAAAQLVDGAALTNLGTSAPLGDITVSATFDGQTVDSGIYVGADPAIDSVGLNGSGKVGEELTCSPNGVTGQPAPTVEITWLKAGSVIQGQTGTTYTPVAGDVDLEVSCHVEANNEFGSAAADSPSVEITKQPDPPAPKPPVVDPKPNVTVPANGKVTIVTLKCPQGTCTVKAPKKVRVKIRGKVYSVTVKAPGKLGEKKSGKVELILPPKARKALKGTKTKAKVKIVVTSTDGKSRVVNRSFTLKGKRR